MRSGWWREVKIAGGEGVTNDFSCFKQYAFCHFGDKERGVEKIDNFSVTLFLNGPYNKKIRTF